MVTLLMVWIYWLIIVLKSTCECVLWINGIELKWFLVWIVETELDELWCLLTWFTWTIVNAYWSIGPLQSLVLKEHRWLLDIQYTPQGIDESLKWFKFVHFNSWLWQLKTHGHNATHPPPHSSHWTTMCTPEKGEQLCMGWELKHKLPENQVPTGESIAETPQVLWQKRTSYSPVWCFTQGTQSLHHPRWSAHSFCEQISDRHRDMLC